MGIYFMRTSDKNGLFNKLYNTYVDKIYRTALMLLNNDQLAQEITQEVFITIYTKLDSLKNIHSFEKWLYKVTTNACINYLKRERKIVILEDSNINSIIDSSSNYLTQDVLIEDFLITKEMQEEIMNLIYSLPEAQRIPLILFYYNDMSYQEIAQVMNCPEGTIKSRIYNAKKILKELLIKGEVRYEKR